VGPMGGVAAAQSAREGEAASGSAKQPAMGSLRCVGHWLGFCLFRALLSREHEQAHAFRTWLYIGRDRECLNAAAGEHTDHVERPRFPDGYLLARQFRERDCRLDLPARLIALNRHEPARVPAEIAPAVVAHAAPLVDLK